MEVAGPWILGINRRRGDFFFLRAGLDDHRSEARTRLPGHAILLPSSGAFVRLWVVPVGGCHHLDRRNRHLPDRGKWLAHFLL